MPSSALLRPTGPRHTSALRKLLAKHKFDDDRQLSRREQYYELIQKRFKNSRCVGRCSDQAPFRLQPIPKTSNSIININPHHTTRLQHWHTSSQNGQSKSQSTVILYDPEQHRNPGDPADGSTTLTKSLFRARLCSCRTSYQFVQSAVI